MAEKLPLAFLPGLLCDAALWQPQIAGLGDIADCWVADFTTQDSATAMVDSVLAAMPERFALAGLSMGGYVALELMARAPERVERLALIDTKARGDSEEQTARRRGLIELAEKGQFKGVTPRLLPLFIHEDRLDDAVLTGVVMGMAERVGKEAFISQQRAIMTRRDHTQILAGIAVPTLILCGRQDALTPLSEHEDMAAAIAGSELVIVEDCGHLPSLERPEPTTAALRRWLQRPLAQT
ncbi:alpha/beta fold hydrolase [Pelagibius litoralis]|uniref:Alpha/beta fold hydrolase n=1 Tax=Pelagibius litoralis TaxID=374515 RepID=A0A967C310_9PROT|nr:alpha/beta fold hydrolase [Pelagibius litoralis]NIA67245.1 alpha/beta fold hydrolase [Pelagibius litoralis]